MNPQFLNEIIECERCDPVDGAASAKRAEDMAFAAGSMITLMVAGTAVPVLGSIFAAMGLTELARLKAESQRAPTSRAHIERMVNEAMLARSLSPASPAAVRETQAWNRWLPWDELQAGAKVQVPRDLPHPSTVGFEPTGLAAYVGQRADWVRPLVDGSRLHVHEYADGTCIVHRDKLDPALGPGTATIHWLTECREGNIAAAALGVGAAVVLWAVLK